MRCLIGIFVLLVPVSLFAQQETGDSASSAAVSSRADSAQQVQIQMKLLEIDRTTLREMGVDLNPVAFGRQAAASRDLKVAAIESGLPKFIIALEKSGFCKVLAEPTIVTAIGRPAYFESGGEVPLKGSKAGSAKSQGFVGTKLDALPTLTKDGKIRLEVRLHVRSVNSSQESVPNARGALTFHANSIDTAVMIPSGHTIVLASAQKKSLVKESQSSDKSTDKSKQTHDIEQVVLIKAELVEPTVAVKPATE